jgi:hypothetical protein
VRWRWLCKQGTWQRRPFPLGLDGEEPHSTGKADTSVIVIVLTSALHPLRRPYRKAHAHVTRMP